MGRGNDVNHMYEDLNLNNLPDGKEKIWHYLDFAKFMFLISEKKLHFSSAEQLTDDFEGSLPKQDVEDRDEQIRRICNNNKNEEEVEKIIDQNRNLSRQFRKYMHLNCWHFNEDESLAMWNLYSMAERGICIQSTIDRLIECFKKEEKYYISLGKVEYIDYSKWQGRIGFPIQRFLLKRKSFNFENEIRALTPGGGRQPTEEHLRGRGIDIPIDIELLIEKVYISPQSPNWFFRLVKLMVQKFDLTIKVHRSKMKDDALF
ncbi:MAG: DUF2971 domain-containing protein [Candidatus Thermoplasmatota archaeon]|nr:DUF2971 domain-containing protein [Candidatus Thermoplasmatota archaeon]